MKALILITLTLKLLFAASPALAQGMLDRIRSTQSITIAHRDSSIPFSYLDANRQPIGYAMDLCLKVVDAIKRELKLTALKVNYLSVRSAMRIPSGEIQVLYKKWFEQPIPPKGINLNLPMPYMLRDSFKYPSDKVADLS
jgi:ABC-type amino acid transport substrate-binding protein